MASSANDDDDLGKHLVIKKSIHIEFKKVTKKKTLEVVFNDEPVTLRNTDNADNKNQYWTLDREIRVFPNSDDILTLRVTNGKKRRLLFKRSEEIKLAHDKIADKFKKPGQAISFLFGTQNWAVTLEVATGDIEDIVATESMADLDPLLSKHVLDAIDSGDSVSQIVLPLKSILELITIPENALQVLENTMETVKDLHPLANAVLTALSIPYQLLKNEDKFKKNLKDLAEAMHTAFECLRDARYHTKITSAKGLFASIMKIIRDAATFIDIYRRNDRFKQFVGAQFSKRLEKYAEELKRNWHDFARAMIVQIADHADEMRPLLKEATVDVREIRSEMLDDLLENRLRPVEQQALEDSCLKGTRVNILSDVRAWLRDYQSTKNILWIVGAPGAGKSTIATTIARELSDEAPFCAKFFSKRDVPDLRDPRQIWPTLAHSLALKHDGVKAALAQTLGKKKGNPKDDLVIEQFQKLIKCIPTDRF